tara:strand:+ start:68 stop:262 length:195 start_codon:yes stop_codon:yes gene_type:complete
MKREIKIELIREALEEADGDDMAYEAIKMTLDLYENPDTTWEDKQKFWSALNSLILGYMPELIK